MDQIETAKQLRELADRIEREQPPRVPTEGERFAERYVRASGRSVCFGLGLEAQYFTVESPSTVTACARTMLAKAIDDLLSAKQ